MDISFKRKRVSFIAALVLIAVLLFFVFSLFSAMRRSNEVEKSQLRLIVDKLQLENRIVFSGIESAVKLEGKKIESGTHILSNITDISFLKNLIDVTDKVLLSVSSPKMVKSLLFKKEIIYTLPIITSLLPIVLPVFLFGMGMKKEK